MFLLFRKKYNTDFFIQIDNYISQTKVNKNIPYSYSEERKRFLEDSFNKKVENWKRIRNIGLVFDQIMETKKQDPFFYEELFLFYEQIKNSTSSSHYQQQKRRGYRKKKMTTYRLHLHMCMIKNPMHSIAYEFNVYNILDSILIAKEKEFNELLLSILTKKNLKNSDVYKSVNMTRKVFSKIYNGQRPSRNSAIMLAFGLKLNIEETQEFLNSAGYSLSCSDTRDLILRYCIENSIKPDTTDIILEHYDVPTLFSQK